MIRKHILKHISQHNKGLYFALTAMLVIASFIFFSITSLNFKYAEAEAQYDASNQEHFQFFPTLYNHQFIEETISDLEQKYEFKSELQVFKYVDNQSDIVKIIKPTSLINTPYIVEGREISEQDELILDINSARRLNLAIGDPYTLVDKVYQIVGIAVFPGQVQPNMSYIGYKPYVASQATLLSISSAQFDQIIAPEKSYYSARWNSVANELPEYLFSFIQYAKDNSEINVLHNKKVMNQIIAGISTGVLLTIIFIMLCMLIYKIISDNEQALGLLKGTGYTNLQIINGFNPFILSLFLPLVVGFVASECLSTSLFTFMNQELILFERGSQIQIALFVSSSLAFLSIAIIFSYFVLLLILKRKPIDMLQGSRSLKFGKVKYKLLNLFNRMKGIKKYAVKYLFSHIFVFILTLFAGFSLSVQALLSLSLYEFPQKLVINGIENQFQYKYEVRLDEAYKIEALKEHENLSPFTYLEHISIGDDADQVSIAIYLLEEIESNSLIKLASYKTGELANERMNNGVAISKWLANKLDINEGDTVYLSADGETYPVIVSLIHKGLQGQELYTSKTYYEKMTSNKFEGANGFFTNEEDWETLIDVSASYVLNQQEINVMTANSMNQYKSISFILLVLGIIISFILFFIAMFVVFQRAQQTILILKTLGYTNKQIFSMLIGGYLLVLLLGVIISIPYLLMFKKLLFEPISKVSTFYLPIEPTIVSIIIVMLAVALLFFIVTYIYFRKIKSMKSFSLLLNV